jgi:pyridoxal phosphate enzyme (YggS family)
LSQYTSQINILENLRQVQVRITQAAGRAGRLPQEITLVVVSKKQELERIRSAYEAGARFFGENYIQEAREKITALDIPAEWHLIGHLQKNKVNQAVALFSLIHTVDSVELARLIDQRARLEGKIQRILLQIKVAPEETKSGVAPEETLNLVRQISEFTHLSLEGFMTIPPFFPDPDQGRPLFARLRELRDQVRSELSPSRHPLRHLSMGMSHDFEAAIEEGATLVRVGSAIFGPRN